MPLFPFTKLSALIWKNDSGGVPYKPIKAEIRKWGEEVEKALSFINVYESRVAFQSSIIPPLVQAVRIDGYYAIADGGGAVYKRLSAAPSVIQTNHIQSLDGAWWRLSEKSINPRQLGAKGDGLTNDTAAFTAAIEYQSNAIDVTSGVYIVDTIIDRSKFKGVGILKYPTFEVNLKDNRDKYVQSYYEGYKLEPLVGVLRQDETVRTQWSFLNDTAHAPAGFDPDPLFYASNGTTILSPRGAGASLRINYKLFTDGARIGANPALSYALVGAMTVTVDEVLAQKYGMVLGAQVLRNAMIINGSCNMRKRMLIYWNGSSWQLNQDNHHQFTGVATTYDPVTGILTVNHDWLPGENIALTQHTRNNLVAGNLIAAACEVPLAMPDYGKRFSVQFLNASGGTFFTKYTGPPVTGMCFVVEKTYSGAVLFDGTFGWDNIDWGVADAGNIWIHGHMIREG